NNNNNNNNPLDPLRKILQKEPKERADEEIDALVTYFDNYDIMSQDIDIYSGISTFRAFIQETRYREYQAHKQIFAQGDLGNEFYFILTGKVSVFVNDDLADIDSDAGDHDQEREKIREEQDKDKAHQDIKEEEKEKEKGEEEEEEEEEEKKKKKKKKK
ncbi:hypothetical protein RFI_20040, partial [Reticulomyxa filosa]